MCVGDFNCIIDKKDATRNQAEKISPSLKRLVSTLEWKDVFRLLHPDDLVYSREYDNAVHVAGATRIDHWYKYGDVTTIEANYVGVAFSDHGGQGMKKKLYDRGQHAAAPSALH